LATPFELEGYTTKGFVKNEDELSHILVLDSESYLWLLEMETNE
jgi:hypothetical protein